MNNQELTVQEKQMQNSGFMQVNTLESAIKCSELIATSSFCPKGMIGRPGDVLVALQMGQELGLKPMQALQNIAVINGRPSLWGDAMLGVCKQSSEYEYIREDFDEATKTAICTVKRRNEPEVIRTFSETDAKTAKLWGKEGPWTTYPKRMLQMRARGFALRDAFPDTLRGIVSVEEAEDLPLERRDYSHISGVTINAKANEVVDETMISVLKDKIEQSDSKWDEISKFIKVDVIEALTVIQWKELCRLLSKKISKKQETESANKFYEQAEEVTE